MRSDLFMLWREGQLSGEKMRGEEKEGGRKRGGKTERGRGRWREDGEGGGKITKFSHKPIKLKFKCMKNK